MDCNTLSGAAKEAGSMQGTEKETLLPVPNLVEDQPRFQTFSSKKNIWASQKVPAQKRKINQSLTKLRSNPDHNMSRQRGKIGRKISL